MVVEVVVFVVGRDWWHGWQSGDGWVQMNDSHHAHIIHSHEIRNVHVWQMGFSFLFFLLVS